jgi:hypothetical protein
MEREMEDWNDSRHRPVVSLNPEHWAFGHRDSAQRFRTEIPHREIPAEKSPSIEECIIAHTEKQKNRKIK